MMRIEAKDLIQKERGDTKSGEVAEGRNRKRGMGNKDKETSCTMSGRKVSRKEEMKVN